MSALQLIAINYASSAEENTGINSITDSEGEEVNPPVRRRKRAHNPYSNKRKANSWKRKKGEKYLGFSTKSGNFKQLWPKPARTIGPKCTSPACLKSKVGYCGQFSDECRLNIFKSFWNMSWEAKLVFIESYVSQIEKKRIYVEDSVRRNSFIFRLPHDNQALQVCRSMFLSTLALKIDMIKGFLKKCNNGVLPSCTKRASKICRSKGYLNEYLKKLDKMESHYCRSNTNKKYIAATFRTKADVYKNYREKCSEHAMRPVSIFTFSKVFDENNLALFMPRKDQCDKCVGYKAQQISEHEYSEHISRKERAHLEKQQDKIRGQEGQCHVFTMDTQAVKLCPNINASSIYFKQRLQVHNFTIYNIANHECTNYWWNETNGDLSASSFISCLIHHLEINCLSDTLPIVIHFDGCGYQNRNNYLSNALSIFAIEHNKTIEQKYLEKGHTQMECDSAHAKIEKKMKNQSIYLPNDYIKITKEARKTVKINNRTINKPFEALYLNYDFFKNYSDRELLRFSSIRPGVTRKDPTVSDLKALNYLPTGDVQYKLNFDDIYKNLPARIKEYSGQNPPKQLHNNTVPITLNKWRHLQQLKAVIPTEYHSFYDNLKKCD